MESVQNKAAARLSSGLSGYRLTILMACACGLTVANMYYCQPLLGQIGTALAARKQSAYLPALTQIGTMFGMGLCVPLGDMFERRRLIVLFCLGLALTSLGSGFAPTFPVLAFVSVLLGFTSIIPHLILPLAAQVAPPEERGKTLGVVLSGLLIGILCARLYSGLLGAAFGWRSVYLSSAVMVLVLAGVLRKTLPESRPTLVFTYPELLKSLWYLFKRFAELREASLIGAMFFGAFSAFWATLIFRLAAPPFHYGSRVAGLFGLIGAAGAAAAPLVGRLADRRGPRSTIGMSLWITIAAYLLFWIIPNSMTGLITGVILMDLGVQAGHVSNQTRIYALLPEARSRLNTVYMFSYFVGGALGSWLGAYAWHRNGWPGVCAVSLLLLLVALVVHYRGIRQTIRRA